MPTPKRRRLESTAAALQQRYGAQALRKASNLSDHTLPPHISTGFPTLDAITGCQGIPLGDITLLSGPNTSGKLTVAYKTLMSAQRSARKSDALVAIIDLNHTADPDYVARAGVDLEHLLIARPSQNEQSVDLLLDLARTQNVRAILVDSLADLYAARGTGRRLQAALGQVRPLLRTANCALLFADEPSPLWQRWLNWDRSAVVRQFAALHIEMQHEQWIVDAGEMTGYRGRACILKSRWARSSETAPIEIRFNGAITARSTW